MGKVTRTKLTYTDVPGAPFTIGTPVRVVQLVDETGNRAWRGRTGTVKFFSYDCGCGQTYPDDPMIGVESARGKVEEFWKEELRILSRGKARQQRVRWHGSKPTCAPTATSYSCGTATIDFIARTK